MRRIMITEKEYAFLIEGIIVQHNLQRYRKAKRQVAMLRLPNEIAKREFKEYCEDRNEPNWVKPFINMLIAFDKKPTLNEPFLDVVGLFEIRDDWSDLHSFIVKELVLFEPNIGKEELYHAIKASISYAAMDNRPAHGYPWFPKKIKIVMKTPLKDKADSIIYKSKQVPPEEIVEINNPEEEIQALRSELNQLWQSYRTAERSYWYLMDLSTYNLSNLATPQLHGICMLLGCRDYTAVGDIESTVRAVKEFLGDKRRANALFAYSDNMPYAIIVNSIDDKGNIYIDKLAFTDKLKGTGKPAELVQTVIHNAPNEVQVEDKNGELKESAKKNPLNDMFDYLKPYEYVYNVTLTSDEIDKLNINRV